MNDEEETTKERVYKSAADILGFDDIPTEEVWVEEWKSWVIVRGMTGRQRDDYEASFVSLKGSKVQSVHLVNVRARLVARCLVDEKGNRLFSDAQVDKLGGKSGAALEKLFVVAQRLSGISDADIQELEENLEPALNGNSGLS